MVPARADSVDTRRADWSMAWPSVASRPCMAAANVAIREWITGQ